MILDWCHSSRANSYATSASSATSLWNFSISGCQSSMATAVLITTALGPFMLLHSSSVVGSRSALCCSFETCAVKGLDMFIVIHFLVLMDSCKLLWFQSTIAIRDGQIRIGQGISAISALWSLWNDLEHLAWGFPIPTVIPSWPSACQRWMGVKLYWMGISHHCNSLCANWVSFGSHRISMSHLHSQFSNYSTPDSITKHDTGTRLHTFGDLKQALLPLWVL